MTFLVEPKITSHFEDCFYFYCDNDNGCACDVPFCSAADMP